ncbi:metal ABC transporter substrate-binding protein [Nocardioides caeni]|nr:metal ABC transporter substrate-binding protein [Nocardioides caeni]
MRLIPGLALVSCVALLGTGCSAFSDSASDDGEVTVAAAFYPLAWVTERVSEDTGTTVELLTQPGGEAHDLELGVQETAIVSGADLVVLQADFQPAVDDTVEQNATGVVLDVSDAADLLAVEESAENHEEYAGETEEEHAEHADEEGHDEHGHDHDHGDADPHFWLDPLRVADVADTVADQLADVDPDQADTYRGNADDLRTELEALDDTWATGLASCERDTIVVSHDAFGYLEKYGLHVASIVGLSPDAEPTPAALGELQELIETEGITTVFSEPLKPALGENLAADLGLSTATLDPLEGLADANSDDDYLSIMNANLAAIRTALDCS